MKSECKTINLGNKKYTNHWFKVGTLVLHREDGPSIENSEGHEEWHINGLRHRSDGPAVKYADGHEEWWYNGKCHKESGPAIVFACGKKHWFLYDIEYTEPQFNLFITLKKLGYNDKVVSLLVKP